MIEKGFWISWKDILDIGAKEVIDKIWKYGATRASLFVVANGVDYFKPKEKYFNKSKLKPIKYNRDVLGEFLREAKRYGIKVSATIVTIVDPLHVKEYPSLSVKDVYGNSHSYAFCPNNKFVRAYLCSLARNIAMEYDIDELELDYIRFKRSRDESLLPLHLFIGRYCYCEYCKRKAIDYGIEWNELINSVKEIMMISSTKNFKRFFDNYSSIGDIIRLYMERPEISKWLNFRSRSIADLVSDIKNCIKDSGVKLSADLFYPRISWQVGQDYRLLGEILDSIKPMIYNIRMGAWETRYLRKILKIIGNKYEEKLKNFLELILGIRIKSLDNFEIKGADPEIVLEEMKRAKSLTSIKTLAGLYSINILPDELLRVSKNAIKAGAEGLYYFSFSKTSKENLEVIKSINV